MTNFEIITQNTTTLDDFITAVQDDALAAKGCSFELHMPPNDDPKAPYVSMKDWLKQEAVDDCVDLPNNKYIVRWEDRSEDDG